MNSRVRHLLARLLKGKRYEADDYGACDADVCRYRRRMQHCRLVEDDRR